MKHKKIIRSLLDNITVKVKLNFKMDTYNSLRVSQISKCFEKNVFKGFPTEVD